jgi:hypothetical protein
MTHPQATVVMVVPVEEQAAASELEKGEVTRPEEPKPLPAEKPKAVEAEERPQPRDSHEDDPQRKKGMGEKLTQKVKCKKVNS